MTTIYLVCSTIRSGSTLLCHYLSDTGLAGNPIDYSDRLYMKQFIEDWKDCYPLTMPYIQRLLEMFPFDPFGMKTPYQSVREHIEQDTLRELFPSEPLYIYITRQDRLKQAISAVRGMQTGKWYSNAEPRQPVMAEFYSAAQITGMMKELDRRENTWEDYFERSHLKPLRVTYEELTDNPLKTVMKVLKFISVKTPTSFELPAPRLEKQADDISLEWERRYKAEVLT